MNRIGSHVLSLVCAPIRNQGGESLDKPDWGNPISTFLFWAVDDLSKAGYKFYKFLKDYRQRFKIHNDEANANLMRSFCAFHPRLNVFRLSQKSTLRKRFNSTRFHL